MKAFSSGHWSAKMPVDQMLTIALWKSPGSLHWRGFSSGGPTKIFTGLFLGGSLASDNLWDLDSRPVEGRARPRSGLKSLFHKSCVECGVWVSSAGVTPSFGGN